MTELINREQLIQELHASDTMHCPEPLKLEDRAPCVREYYERLATVVEAHLRRPRKKLVWAGNCNNCGHYQMYAQGGPRKCQWGHCLGIVYPRITEIDAP